MLKYLVARLLDTSKNTYYFLFILTKKVILHRSPKTLLVKNNIVLSTSSCRGMIWHAWKIRFLYSLGMLRHEWGMPRHVNLGFLTGRPLSWLAQFCFFWLFFALICSFFDHSTRTSPTRWKHTLKCPKQVINNTKH